ncbi:MAG: TetR-like C-terminal domain-containing protein [Bilifractor sp.]|nr:TetR family transcriptional regulator C-terminal domain-containing protein [Lachnospiraceae bacterium]MDY2838229.1 TetR-like C-terminal domain-containing protein [Bilifractor sp.]
MAHGGASDYPGIRFRNPGGSGKKSDAGLLYLLQDEFFMAFGPSDDDNDIAAYSKAFFTYSTFGFLETWIRRGMKESAAEMEALLLIIVRK